MWGTIPFVFDLLAHIPAESRPTSKRNPAPLPTESVPHFDRNTHLDDVWDVADIEPFRIGSARSRVLITTRDTSIASAFGARSFTAEILSDQESREVLARWAGTPSANLPSESAEIIRECGNLPLALAIIGAQLRNKPVGHWKIVLDHLRHANRQKITALFPEPHTTLFRAIDVSFQALRKQNPEAAHRYLKLAVLLADMPAPSAVQCTLWNVDKVAAAETADHFVDLSLAQRDPETESIRLHDLQLDYVRLLYCDPVALNLIHDALRLSAHVIEKDPRQFASQVTGRLLLHQDHASVRQFSDEIASAAPRPWLRLRHPALHPAGTSLFRTLEGHTGAVRAVAVTPDGRRAVSASGDCTVKVWDLETGRELGSLAGHASVVLAVALTPDGRRAVSTSADHMLKVWDLEAGRELRSLAGHTQLVHAVAATPDGRRAVSASYDCTLKVWDLETGREIRSLVGHASVVLAVAVTPDGRRAVSASHDNTLKVWGLKAGVPVCTFSCEASARCCAFAGNHGVIAGDGAGRLYSLSLTETNNPFKSKSSRT